MTAKDSVLQAYRDSSEKLVSALESFHQHNFNTKPSVEAWSAAMVTDHLLKLEKRINQIISSPAKITDRIPDEKLAIMRTIFPDRKVKLKAPSFLIPGTDQADKETLVEELRREKQEVISNAEKVELAELCTDFPNNRLGEMTRLEWLWFNIFHTERHLQQIKEIEEVVIQK